MNRRYLFKTLLAFVVAFSFGALLLITVLPKAHWDLVFGLLLVPGFVGVVIIGRRAAQIGKSD